MNKNGKGKIIGAIVAIAVIVFALAFGGMKLLDNAGKSKTELTVEDTVAQLNKYVDKKVDLKEKQNPIKGTVDLEASSLESELPSIDKYPFKVEGNGDVNIEIFSSPEKAGKETSNGKDDVYNTWLIKVVEDFNKRGFTISDGSSISVSLRSLSSGVMVDYITSGKYIPDGITPSNENWISMLEANGVTLNRETESMVGNVAGIVLSQKTYDQIIKDYGSVNLGTIADATIANEIAMGYTNPYASSTGLNFLMSSLYKFSPSDPLGDEAIESFQKFQANVPVVSYNTTQMQGAIDSGVLDAMILEYQIFANSPELRTYTFVPFGIRHDNPLYSIGDLSPEKKEAFKIFADFAGNEESQKLAKKYGFNGYPDYVAEVPSADGKTLLSAQTLWKEKKTMVKF